MKSRKRLAIFLGLILIVGLAILILSLTNKQAAPPTPHTQIRIGAILPLTGNLAFLGEPERLAIQVAVNEINNSGESPSVHVIFEDSRGQAKDAVSALQKLIATDKIDVGIVSTSALSNAVAPVAADAKIPLITLCSDDSIAQNFSNVSNIYINLEQEQRAMANHLRRRGIQTICSIRVNAQVTERGVDLLKQFSSDSLSVSLDLPYDLAKPDYQTLAAKAQASTAEALYIMGYGVEFPALVKALREAGYQRPIFGNYTFLTDAARQADTSLYEGIEFTTFPATASDLSATSFGKHYQEASGAPLGPFLDYVFAYEALKIVHEILQSNPDPSHLPTLLRNNTFETILGEVSIDENGSASVPMRIGRFNVATGEVVIIGEYEE